MKNSDVIVITIRCASVGSEDEDIDVTSDEERNILEEIKQEVKKNVASEMKQELDVYRLAKISATKGDVCWKNSAGEC